MAKILILTIILLNLVPVSGKEGTESGKVQVSFVYPVGSNGTESREISNKYSINILGGINGGVKGFELGGVFNLNSGDVTGFQLSGGANYTHENSKGCIISGGVNYTEKDQVGVEFAPINIVLENSAVQFGAINYSGSLTGLQCAPINYTGLVNGVQIGVVNITNKLSGNQFGLINYSNSYEEGTPFGVINIVRDGFFNAMISSDEIFYSNLSYKMGVRKFYTIFDFGYSSDSGRDLYGTGFGFGSQLDLMPKHTLAVEVLGKAISYKGDEFKGLNLLTTFAALYSYELFENFSISAGPTLNNYITDRETRKKYRTLDTPYTLYESDKDNRNRVKGWIGFKAGISYTL